MHSPSLRFKHPLTSWRGWMAALLAVTLWSGAVHAADPQSPDALIKEVSTDVIESAKADKSIQAGDLQKVIGLVDTKVMPHVNFQRMTISTVGSRNWNAATDEQKKRLLEEYKVLLMRTYAGALTLVKDQTVQVSPLRSAPTDNEVVVRTKVRGGGEPVQLDYRLEKADQGWKIYDVNVSGFWLTEQFRNSWAQEISANGLDGLIANLAKRNKSAATVPAKG
ncbi:MAG: ABC transporter substrate-binding protein [Pseudomonadota bacterium]